MMQFPRTKIETKSVAAIEMNNDEVNNYIITGSESNLSIADSITSTQPDSPNRSLTETHVSTEVTPGSHPDENAALTFGAYDVFFASGNFSKKRLGNAELTRICKLYQSQYDAALKAQQKLGMVDADSSVYKSTIMKNIIAHFRREHPSSKIWTRKHGGEWIDITCDNDIIVSKLQFKLCRKKGEDFVRLKKKNNDEITINGRSKKAKAENSSKSRDELNDSNRSISMEASQIVASNDAIIVSLSRIITDLERDRESLKRQLDSLKEVNKQLEEKVKALEISSSTLTSIAHTSISSDEKSTNTEFFLCDEMCDELLTNNDESPVAEEMSDGQYRK